MIEAVGQNDRLATGLSSCCVFLLLFPRFLRNRSRGSRQEGKQASRSHGTWIRSSSCRRTAFQTRMSAIEHVMKRSEQPAGNMTSFTRAKWQVPRSSVSISIVTQYLFRFIFDFVLGLRGVA